MSSPRHPLVLGINAAYHQSAAALVCADGVVAAMEEERFNRVKHGKATQVDTTYHLPVRAIDACLAQAGVGLADIDHIAYSFNPDRRERRAAEIAEIGPMLGGGYETVGGDRRFLALIRSAPDVLAALHDVPVEQIRNRWAWVDHHIAHLASAFLPSPFEEAAGLVIDGIGEDATTTLALCRGTEMNVLRVIDFPHSLGFAWELITNFLGFEGNYDECKVMGLAAYGNASTMGERLRRMLRPTSNGGFEVDFMDHAALLRGDYSAIESLLGGLQRRVPHEPIRFAPGQGEHADVAAALQAITNEVFLSLARWAREQTGLPKLVVAGGVALNAVANGVVARQGGFEDMWVQPAASDAGTALGAALHVLHDPSRGAVRQRVAGSSPYLGPEFGEAEIGSALDSFRLQYRRVSDPAAEAAAQIARGRVVGWFQGRMEFGPRALGNRSLLADPRSAETRTRINRHVKHRQDFRPFAPAVLAEHAHEWFDADHFPEAARHMLVTYQTRPERAHLIPAVIHADGTSRLQLLRRDDNPLFYRLVAAFHQLTGVPMVLNTSLNDREPIVCTPEDAARCFLKTNIDVMILGNHVVEGPKPWERHDRTRTVLDDLRAFDSFREGEAS